MSQSFLIRDTGPQGYQGYQGVPGGGGQMMQGSDDPPTAVGNPPPDLTKPALYTIDSGPNKGVSYTWIVIDQDWF